MAVFSLISVQAIIDSNFSCREICDELVRLFYEELQLKAEEGLANENWSKETLTNFWFWLTECDLKDNKKTETELSLHIHNKLSQIIKRCDSDETLFKYVFKSIKNYSSRDKDLFRKFARAFYKKTRGALVNDNRFVLIKQEDRLFFGLQKWGNAIQRLCYELSNEQRAIARALKERRYFPNVKWPYSDSFISSKELTNASYRTLNYESFSFYSTLAIIFDLIRLTGQFGVLIPSFVKIDPNDNEGGCKSGGIENIPSPESHSSTDWSDGRALALAFWKLLSKQEKTLLSYYIIPKASGQKIARVDVVSIIGFNNEVTMKNYEERLVERLKLYCKKQDILSEPELYVPFMQELENLTEDLKTGESGHSCTVAAMEDK